MSLRSTFSSRSSRIRCATNCACSAPSFSATSAGLSAFDSRVALNCLLNFVRVLVFIDEDEVKLPSIEFRDPLVLVKHRQGFLQQVVEIRRVGRLLLFFVSLVDILNLVE